MIVNIDLSQEIFAIDMLRALKSSLKHRLKHVLRPLQLYRDQALVSLIGVWIVIKLQLHDAIYWLRFYSNSLIHILSLSNSHNNIGSIQKNRDDKSHRVIVA